MNLPERRTFWACAAGWALDGMDFMIYPLVIGTIIAMWKVDAGTAGLAGTVTLLASAVGGWLGGYLADRIGRVKTLQLTILWFSVFSLVCAFVQNFDQLLIARALLGLGFGGEWAAGAVLMGESIRPQYRGRAVGSVQSGWAVGWGLAVLSQAILFSYLPPEMAWRWMFAIGALPALLVFFLRRYVEEPEIAAATLAKQNASGERPATAGDFRRPDSQDHDSGVAGGDGMPGRLLRHHLLGAALSHHRAQALGRRLHRLSRRADHRLVRRLSGRRVARRQDRPAQSVSVSSRSARSPSSSLYTQLPLTNEVLWVLGFPLGFFASAYFSGVGAFLTELYPTRLRGSGQGFCYNFGRGIGALFPYLVGALSTATSLGNAIAIFAVLAYGLFFIAAFALPETRGRILHADA